MSQSLSKAKSWLNKRRSWLNLIYFFSKLFLIFELIYSEETGAKKSHDRSPLSTWSGPAPNASTHLLPSPTDDLFYGHEYCYASMYIF